MKIVILAGGKGSRLWPLSTPSFPKPLLRFGESFSLLQKTILRFLTVFSAEDIVIVTSACCAEALQKQCLEVDPSGKIAVLQEEFPRGTAAAFCMACAFLEKKRKIDPLEPILLSPSDAFIEPVDQFLETVFQASEAAKEGFLVLLGVKPTYAEEGFGYMELRGEGPLFFVERFIEKPTSSVLQELLKTKNTLWNTGHLLVTIKTLQEELSLYPLPDREISLDYALLEKSRRILAAPLAVNWSDLGSWDTLLQGQENHCTASIALLDTKSCLFLGSHKPIVAIGVEDLICIDGKEGLLLMKRGESHKLGQIALTKSVSTDLFLDKGERYAIKKVTVQAGSPLLWQVDQGIAEHWMLAQGVALVEREEEVFILQEQESYIASALTQYKVSNLGKGPLVFIVTQMALEPVLC